MNRDFLHNISVILAKAGIPALLLACLLTSTDASAATIGKPVSNLGLVAHWSFDEGTSSIAHDLSGNGNNGSLVNMDAATDWVPGKRGKALDFDGVNDTVLTTNNLTIAGGSFSITAWFKTTSAGDIKIFSSNNTSHQLQVLSGALRTCISSTCTAGTTRVDDGLWHHAAVVGDATSIRVYLDGRTTPEITGPASGADMTGIPRIAAVGAEGGAWPASHHYIGQIDDVRVYNRTLSTTDVVNLYRSGQSSHFAATKTGLAAYWSFNEGSGTIIHDQSGNGKNGSLAGTATWGDGKFGKAMSLSGGLASGYALVSGITSIPVNGPATISGWFYATTTAVARGISSFLFEDLYQHPVNSMLYLQNGADYFQTQNAFTLNAWHHIVLTYNGQHETAVLYFDGVRYDVTIQTAGQNHTNLNPVYIGSDGGGGGGTFPGKIDDVRIYNRVLTQDEILSLYRAKETVINASRNTELTSGLLGYWTYNGPDVITTVADVSGQGNHGYVIGTATSTAKTIGKIGQGFRFSGSNSEYVQVSGITSGTLSSNFTVSTWINPTTLAGANEYTVLGTRLSNSSGWQLGVGATAGTCGGPSCIIWRTFNGSQFNVNTGGTNYVPTNRWTHVAVVHGNGSADIYVNGALVSTQSITNPAASNSQPLRIAYIGVGSGGFSWTGSIDETRIYNRALTAAEVKQLYNRGQ